jgi:pimeloyl-ACP methyl ester carboxylesterase
MGSGRFDRDLKADMQESLAGWPLRLARRRSRDGRALGFALAAIETPALLVQGGQDLMVPAAHATLEFLPEEGHMTLGMEPGRALEWLLPRIR